MRFYARHLIWIAFVASLPAAGQEQVAQSAAAGGGGPGGAVGGQPPVDSAAAGKLEEVTVTARYQAENLQQTPISITAITAEDLEKKGIQNLTDISKEVPNLKLDPNEAAFGNSASVFIRGIGETDFDYAFDPGVGIYIDGVYFGTIYGNQLDLSDVADIQVLRGPQGTLFGRSTEGGAVLISTVRPKGDYSGYAEVGYGSYNHEQFKGAFDIPLIQDQLSMRLAVGVDNVDGYVDTIDYACAHPAQAAAFNATYVPLGATPLKPTTTAPGCKTGELGGSDTDNYHGAILWTPSADLKVLLTGDLLDIRGEQPAAITTYIDPFYPGSFGFLSPGYTKQFVAPGHYSSYQAYLDPTTGLDFPNKNDTFSWGFSGTLDWDTPWGVHVRNIAAYRKYDGEFGSWDGGAPIPLDNTDNVVDHHQFSEEFQLSGKLFDGRMDWTAGAYYYTAYSKYYALNDEPLFFGFLFVQDDPIIDHNTSGFLHDLFHVDDQFSIETGVRYSTESKSYTFYRADPYTGGPSPSLPGFPVNYGPLTASSSRFDPKVEFQYQLTPEAMGYFSVATGFKGGGINPRPSLPDQIDAFKPEDLTAYEVGTKTQWFDNRLRFNADIFGEDYKDLQTTFVPPGSAGTVTVNTGHVLLYGAELELDATPIPGLQIDTNAGWLHNRTLRLGSAGECPDGYIPPNLSAATVSVDQLENATCQVDGLQPGQKLPGIPAWKIHAGVQYSYDLPDSIGTLTPRLDWSYTGTEYFGTQASTQQIQPNGPGTPLVSVAYPVIGRQPGYSTFDTRLAYDSADGNWTAAFQVFNLTNAFYYLNGFALLNSEGHIDQAPSLPRTYFFSIKRIFQPQTEAAAYTPPPAPPPAPAPAPAPAVQPEAQREFQVFFDFDKSTITEAAAKVIAAAADVVKHGGIAHLTVTGHTDTVGTAKYNQALSERRAASVKSQLVSDGVDGGEVTTVGVGKSGLLVPTADGVREPQNRRAVIELQ